MKRRALLHLAGLSLLPIGLTAQADSVFALTPSQTEGPYYPLEPIAVSGDLVLDASKLGGEVLELSGRVTDRQGRGVPGIRVEIWQSDHQGIYNHPDDDKRAQHDPHFAGAGAQMTNATGAYAFRAMYPVAYRSRPPHIHVKLWRGDRELLTSQLYLRGQTGFEWGGKLLSGMLDFAREHLLITPVRSDESQPYRAQFNFVIQPT